MSSNDHNAIIPALLAMLDRNVNVIRMNSADITQADSLLTVAEGGSNLNWLLGHLVSTRDDILRMLGSETVWDEQHDEKYQRGSELPAVAEVDQINNLLLALDRSQELLAVALSATTPAQLAEPSGMRGQDKLGTLQFQVWHDTYHTGQTAVYRRVAGLEGTMG